jgi:hypothetical protein
MPRHRFKRRLPIGSSGSRQPVWPRYVRAALLLLAVPVGADGGGPGFVPPPEPPPESRADPLPVSNSASEQEPEGPEAAAPEAPAEAALPAETPPLPARLPARNYYIEPRSYGTRREPEPPRYVRSLDETGIRGWERYPWMDLGLDYRTRYEYRDDDLRRPIGVVDQPILPRTRFYLGVNEIIDPFRFAVEIEDARRYNSVFPRDIRDVNQMAFVQAYGELHFANALGINRPARLQAGRLAFEYLDRRLIARNDWRNTTGNFQGYRLLLGQESNDWNLDVLALHPVLLSMSGPDRPDASRRFYGVIGNWRRWSEIVTLQPYHLVLEQRPGEDRARRRIHTTGLRGYGILGRTGYDYDLNLALQFGRDGHRTHRALGLASEVGYVWNHPWSPRVSAFFGYGSGDRDPDDDRSERFDALFGFRRPWSANDYFGWDNIISSKLRLEVRPLRDLRLELGYGPFWVASATDSWRDAGRRDPTGRSGTFVGHEFDLRARYPLNSRVDLTIGYAYFFPGAFTRNTGRGDRTHFFYAETIVRAFR